MLLALWPQGWSRQQRSNATLVAALVVMVLALSLLGQLLSFFPDPIGPNAQAFSEGARTTLWLTLVSGAVGLVLGTAAALARTARWTPVRWVAGVYIWAIRGTPLQVADALEEWHSAGACDGFMMMFPMMQDGLTHFVNGVVPELQRRGLLRTEQDGVTLRDALGIPRPPHPATLTASSEHAAE